MLDPDSQALQTVAVELFPGFSAWFGSVAMSEPVVSEHLAPALLVLTALVVFGLWACDIVGL
jgi:hypothetical protein